jgi:hypothetical protein
MKSIRSQQFIKPNCLTDPFLEWENEEDFLQEIVKKNSTDLNYNDFKAIFYRILPAASYEEGLYYLIPCIDYIRSTKSIHVSHYPDSLLSWVNDHKDNLENDGLLDSTIGEILHLFKSLLSDFELYELTELQCNEIGRDFDYSISPYNNKTIHCLIDDITRFPLFSKLLENIIDYLISDNSLSTIRWYTDIAHHTRYWTVIYNSDDPHDSYTQKEYLFKRLHEFKHFCEKSRVSSEATSREKKYKYNKLLSFV